MTPMQFLNGLDAWGADLAAWPEQKREAALRLIAASAEVRAMHAQARRLAETIEQAVTSSSAVAAEEALGARVLARLEFRPLPAQRRPVWTRWWPDALVNRDFAPAWPRVAGLALAGCLGLIIGLFGITITPNDSALSSAAASSFMEADLAVLVSEPEPLTGARP